MGSGTQHTLSKPGAQFLNINRLLQSSNFQSIRDEACAWAQELGLITPSIHYSVSWYDDELDDERTMTFGSREDAEHEVDGTDIEICEHAGWAATTRLIEWTNQTNIDPSLVEEMAIICYAEVFMGLDGVWWTDIHDPLKYSAPRGGIFPRKLHTFFRSLK